MHVYTLGGQGSFLINTPAKQPEKKKTQAAAKEPAKQPARKEEQQRTNNTHRLLYNHRTQTFQQLNRSNQNDREPSTTTKYTFNIKRVLVFTSTQKIYEGKDTHCEFLHQLT